MRLRCFTLIETLAVLMLLGLVAGWSLSLIDRNASPRVVGQRFAAIDARARLLASVEGPQVLELLDTHVQLSSIRDPDRIRSFSLGSNLGLQRENAPVDRIVYDRLGQTVDFELVSENHEKAILNVHGLTGWLEQLQEVSR